MARKVSPMKRERVVEAKKGHYLCGNWVTKSKLRADFGNRRTTF